MASISSVLTTPFIPAAGDFIVQVVGGIATLERRNNATAAWTRVGEITPNQAMVVDNPVGLAEYRFIAQSGSPTVQADQ